MFYIKDPRINKASRHVDSGELMRRVKNYIEWGRRPGQVSPAESLTEYLDAKCQTVRGNEL